jgi:hypothetical protein
LTGTVGNLESFEHAIHFGNVVNLFNNHWSDWDGHDVTAGNHAVGLQMQQIMASLLIITVSKVNTIESARGSCIGWIWFIVSLNIGAKSILAMLVLLHPNPVILSIESRMDEPTQS